jgi:hypothetical protein
MRFRTSASIAFIAAATPLLCQTNTVNDIGLVMSSSNAGSVFGQACGPVTCATFPAGTVGLGATRGLTHYGAPNSPYVLAIGLPGPCTPFPGIGNFLNLAIPMQTLAIGVASAPNPTSACLQGSGRYVLNLPAAAPTPITFRVQSLGMSNSGAPAFGPAIEATLQ